MSEGRATTGEARTLAGFIDTIHRGGIGLRACSPQRCLDRHRQVFWGTAGEILGIDALFARVNAGDRDGPVRDRMASATDPQPYAFDFRIGEGGQQTRQRHR
ncbi:hypothetical protein [Methylobacterium tarhaniae]|uniref:hypothetical protein n=1 Tax=Methylobacterium tarhaniae TaxID=1187852 RepID=UPI003CFBF9A9